ncbi:membrane lipoprotein lipid attachment site-containing protein [Epilithonimonas xixisoli]|uniref:Lipoprotein n=1 Tax=Epilithonimonas xixisoli TaxID=1476462 RepID=A0A4R8IHW4_9FLAO|nr:membrane lipoprotein lipid attachment site-containing protein [Epilithonimonas xixisoli]TDX86109.1 hypothetical protein B0I22_0215 [Epilithonimonas xixisoli]
MKKLILFLFATIALSSCTVYGWGDDSDKMPDHYRYRVKSLESFDNLNSNLIYKITGEQLTEELKKHPKAIVYIFTNGTDRRIKPLKDYIEFAKNNDYKLFFVMDGYMNLRQTLEELNSNPSPVFVINRNSDEDNFKPSYVSRFENRLNVNIIVDGKKITCFNCLLYFENGDFIKRIEEYSGTKPRKRITFNGK